MAALYPNHRLAALPCESMRGCVFAEDFITETKVRDNNGIPSASAVVDHGVALGGNSQVSFGNWDDHTCTDYLSVVLRFATTTQETGTKLLLGNTHTFSNGVRIEIDADGIKANHNDGGVEPTECSVDLNYYDGEIHTVTYLIDLVSGEHHLYVDALAVDTQTTSKSSIIAAAGLIYVSSTIAGAFGGTVYKVRIFEQLLTEAEHDLYHADTLTDFMDQPTAVWRCDSFSNDGTSNTINDRTVNHNDLYKGDRSTAAGFPTFDTDKYLFDKVDDYVSSFPTLPATYTITGISSTPQVPYPTIQQHNDTTFSLPLTVAGSYWGYLHSLILHSKSLTQLEKYHDQYQHQYWQSRGRASLAYNRLITEGVCVFAQFMDASWAYKDFASLAGGIASGVTRGGAAGCTFSGTDNVTFFHDANHQLTEGTIVVFGDFSGAYTSETYVEKEDNYKFSCTVGGNLILGGTVDSLHVMTAVDWEDCEHIAVVFRDAEKARFYKDGKYMGDGVSSATLDDTATNDLIIGNNNTLTDAVDRAIKHVAIFNKVLTEREIKALYESAKVISEETMETGNRTPDVTQYSGAVSKAVDPGAPFQLIEVKMKWDSAPTTSENIVINSIYGGVTYAEHTYDPSVSSDTTHVFRFDKRFADNTTLSVTYTNTDANTIDVLVVYQNDDSVN